MFIQNIQNKNSIRYTSTLNKKKVTEQIHDIFLFIFQVVLSVQTLHFISFLANDYINQDVFLPILVTIKRLWFLAKFVIF